MNAWWKIGIIAAWSVAWGMAGWHARTVEDEARLAEAEQAQITQQARAQQANDRAAQDYEKQRQTMEGRINALNEYLSQVQRKTPAPCAVPGDVVRAVNSALTD